MVNPPFITGELSDLVLGSLAVPELHLLIGIVDKLLKGLEDTLGRDIVNTFLKEECIIRKAYQGQHSLDYATEKFDGSLERY